MEVLKKMLSREWIGTVGLAAVASVAFLQKIITFVEWAAFCGPLFVAYQGIKKHAEKTGA